MQAIDLYVKTTKRAMLTLSFSAEKINLRGRANYQHEMFCTRAKVLLEKLFNVSRDAGRSVV